MKMHYRFPNEPGWCHGKIKNAGYRLTIPRRAILQVLNNSRSHMSAEEIYLEVHKMYPAIGLTTVYRTLEMLVRMGLVSKFDFGDKRARYELAEGPGSKGHHHHLVCTKCGRIIDYKDFIDEEQELINKTEKGLSKKFNFEIHNHIIHFYGVCESCREKGL